MGRSLKCESKRVIKSSPCAMAGHGNAMPMKIQYFIIHNRSRSIIIFYLSSLKQVTYLGIEKKEGGENKKTN